MDSEQGQMKVTAPGGGGTTLDFNVSGAEATKYAEKIAALIQPGGIFSVLSSGQKESKVAGAVNEIFADTVSAFTLATGRQISYVGSRHPVILTGSKAGDDSVVGGNGLTYGARGAHDLVVFIKGDNVFNDYPLRATMRSWRAAAMTRSIPASARPGFSAARGTR
jgi:hypothetical protein